MKVRKCVLSILAQKPPPQMRNLRFIRGEGPVVAPLGPIRQLGCIFPERILASFNSIYRVFRSLISTIINML